MDPVLVNAQPYMTRVPALQASWPSSPSQLHHLENFICRVVIGVLYSPL